MSLFDGYEEYSKQGRCYAERVSISSTGGISFNTTAFRELGLQHYHYAAFFFNPQNQCVGIRFSAKELHGGYLLKPRKNAKGEDALYLSIKGFVMTYRISRDKKITKYRIFKQEKLDDNLEVILSPILDKEEK